MSIKIVLHQLIYLQWLKPGGNIFTFKYLKSKHNKPQKEEKGDNYSARTNHLCSKIHPMRM